MLISSYDTDDQVFIIAEIGNCHEGDFELAKDMIAQAAELGVQAVKFQTIVPEQLVSVANVDRIKQLQRFQFSYEQFAELAEVAQNNNVLFLSTPFDIKSLQFLSDYMPAIKIASSDNNFFPLIEEAASTGLPLIISTGVSTWSELEKLKAFVEKKWADNGTKQELCFLHCVTAYPTPELEANIACIAQLAELGVVPGYSDHTLGIEAAVLSVALGARIVEKHFTLDKQYSEFRDHQLSADPAELGELVRRIRQAEVLLGSPTKEIQPTEQSLLTAVRRSIAANKDLEKGTELNLAHLRWTRPGDGLSPGEESKLLGRVLVRSLKEGENITLEDVQ